MADEKKKWNIDIESIKDPDYTKWLGDYSGAKVQMEQRTHRYELYGLIAKNKSIHEWSSRKKSGEYFSEGSSQSILRKSLADTVQRVPDGELDTQYDKASVEHIQTEYIFNNKVLWSEFEGIDMLSNITNTFKAGFTYGFAPVRTGFEKDYDNSARISYNIENWSDVFVNQDCKDVRRPQVVWHRSFMSKAEVEGLLTESGEARDKTYNAETIKYLIENDQFSGKPWESEKLSDKLRGSTSLSSIELLTKYERGADEFITYAPSLRAEFRRVPNYDPRKGIPWNFFVLETDADFPLGVSQIEFLLADQQFQDLFQTSAYKNLLLAMEPPIKVAGWETNPSSYRFEPRKIWNLGNNPNQVMVEPVQIENNVLNTFLQTREGIASGMLRQLNVLDGTVARDSFVPGFSATPQGVMAQERTRGVSVNQYQKRIENFFSEWANQAMRMYLNSMGGVHELTVDEKTRRKLFDIGRMDLIVGDKITIDFNAFSTDLLSFKVRTGSLVERKEDQEVKNLQATIQPFVQNLNGWSEQNKAIIENEVLLPAARRLLELSDTDIGQTLAAGITKHITEMAMEEMKTQIQDQQAQLDEQGMRLEGIQGALPPDIQAGLAQAEPPVALGEGELAPEIPMAPDMGGASPSIPPISDQIPIRPSEPAGQQVIRPADLLEM